MNLSGTWHRYNDRTAQRQGHRFVLSLIFSGLAIALLSLTLGKQMPSIVEKTRMTSLLAPISEGRLKVIEHYAVTGDWLWLDETKPDEKHPTNLISAQIGHIRQGAVHIEVRNRKTPLESWTTRYMLFQQGDFDTEIDDRENPPAPPEWWSIRPAVTRDDAPTVLWVCGSRSPPAGFRALGEDLTTIPPEENFRLCR